MARKRASAVEPVMFSLEDPEAGTAFVRHLHRRDVMRVGFEDACRMFGCRTLRDRWALEAMLTDLAARGLIQPMSNGTYCRPPMAPTPTDTPPPLASSPSGKVTATPRPKPIRSDRQARDSECARLLEFIGRHDDPVSYAALIAEGEKHGMKPERTKYLLKCLVHEARLERTGHGLYRVPAAASEIASAT